MAGKLVTIATFEQGARAHLACGVLEESGIKAVVTDEAVVTMDWLLGGAVGWVKVQVLEEQADRAVTVLEEAFGSETGPVDETELAAEAEAAGPPDGGEAPQIKTAATDTDVPGAPSERDEYAVRLFRAAFFTFAFPPLWFYAVYLFLNATFGEGSLSQHGRNKLFAGGCFLALGLPFGMLVIPLFTNFFP